MSENKGQPVSTGRNRQRPPTDLDHLLTYMQGGFVTHREQMLDMVQEASVLRSRVDLVRLGAMTLRFAAELDLWIEIARAAIEFERGNELQFSRENAEVAKGERRVLSDEMKAKAAAQLAPLMSLYNILKSTRDSARSTNRWAQVQQQTIRQDEFGDLLLQDADLTEMFDAPLDSTIAGSMPT